MILKNISEAKAERSALIDAVSKGEEVLIGKRACRSQSSSATPLSRPSAYLVR